MPALSRGRNLILGLLSLLLSSSFLGLWVRSLYVTDILVVRSGTRWSDAIVSEEGLLMWADTDQQPSSGLMSWNRSGSPGFIDQESIDWRPAFLGFRSGEFDSVRSVTPLHGRISCIPYWAIVAASMMLSGWFLLVQPQNLRKRDSPNTESSDQDQHPFNTGRRLPPLAVEQGG